MSSNLQTQNNAYPVNPKGLEREPFPTMNPIQSAITHMVLETPGRKIGFDRLIQRLENSGSRMDRRLGSLKDRSGNRRVLSQIIREERWSQRRLHAALGESVPQDTPEDYQPQQQDWPALLDAFHRTRQATISLCKSLRMAGVDPSTHIDHHRWGMLSLFGWLHYLNLHEKWLSLQFS